MYSRIYKSVFIQRKKLLYVVYTSVHIHTCMSKPNIKNKSVWLLLTANSLHMYIACPCYVKKNRNFFYTGTFVYQQSRIFFLIIITFFFIWRGWGKLNDKWKEDNTIDFDIHCVTTDYRDWYKNNDVLPISKSVVITGCIYV